MYVRIVIFPLPLLLSDNMSQGQSLSKTKKAAAKLAGSIFEDVPSGIFDLFVIRLSDCGQGEFAGLPGAR